MTRPDINQFPECGKNNCPGVLLPVAKPFLEREQVGYRAIANVPKGTHEYWECSQCGRIVGA